MTPAPWHTVLALALVGERFDLGLQDRPDVARLLADLDSRGFGRRRVEQIARGTSPWPFPLLPADREGLGGAQFFAALREARRALGLETLTVHAPSRRRELNADERRLLADVPPHWGNG